MSLDMERLADVILAAVRREVDPVLELISALEKRMPQVGPAGERGKDGRDGIDGKDGAPGERGKDGRDGIDGKDGAPGRDGRDGMTVVGEKGLDGKPGADGKDGRDGKDGAPGRDGTLEQLKVVQSEDLRTVTLCFKDGQPIEGGVIRFPVPLYRGVYDGAKAYEPGDEVTHAGSMWIATADTKEVPGEGATAWVLCTKRGRDGKPGEKGLEGKEGRPGRDLTQLGTDGRKW